MNIDFAEAFSEIRERKGIIDKATMMSIVKDSFLNVLAREFGTTDNIDIIVNIDKGDFEIWRNREVVADENFDNVATQIKLSEVAKIDSDYEEGEEFSDEVKIEDFGRRAILSLRQNMAARIAEIEKEHTFNQYKDKIGALVTGEVYQVWKREILVVDDFGSDLILPKSEQIPRDFFRKGDTVKAVVVEVQMKKSTPVIIISRTSPLFLNCLFEQEVPEVFDGLITIKKVVRAPGDRAKVTVESYDERVDPVGACVGMKGSRIHSIVRELRSENIDIVNFSNNTALYIQRALGIKQHTDIKIDEEKKAVSVFLPPEEVSKAIGRGGVNIRLASQLTGYTIDIYRNEGTEEEDVQLDEFSDELDDWVIDTLKNIGCDTAKDVLRISKEDLAIRTDLEEETVEHILKTLQTEFE